MKRYFLTLQLSSHIKFNLSDKPVDKNKNNKKICLSNLVIF